MTSSVFDEARRLLEHPPTPDPGLWGRVAVLLTRQSLEASLDGLWERRSPDLRQVSMRAQLICLGEFMDDALAAGNATQLWNTLSRACHYDDNYLAPNAAEVADWLERAERLCAIIDGR